MDSPSIFITFVQVLPASRRRQLGHGGFGGGCGFIDGYNGRIVGSEG